MRYLVLVSHGTFAPGLHSVLKMLAGDREDILSCSLEDGMTADAYVANLRETIKPITKDDTVFLFGDIVGGSPLTNAMNVLTEEGLLTGARIFGGVNLPAVLIAALEGDQDDDALAAMILEEGKNGLQEFVVNIDDEDEEL